MDENIVYQSNDVLFKVLSENYKNIALNIYGFNFPQIKSMIPNTFPAVKADEKQQMTIIAGLLTASNKYIDEEYAKEVRRWMKMTAVDKVYEKEKQEAIEKERLEKEKERLEKEKERLEKQQAIIGLQNMVMSTIKNRYNSTSVTLVKSIGKITDISVLQLINDEIFKAEDIKTLEKFVKEIIE